MKPASNRGFAVWPASCLAKLIATIESHGLLRGMDKTTILLIRHGETDWNAEGRWQGHTDIPLNETGRRQARLLAQRLRDWPISAIYCSDLQRAYETAAIIAQQVGLECIVDDVWRERDNGQFAGLTSLDIRERHPEIWARMKQGFVEVPGGESTNALFRRVRSGFEKLVRQHSREIVAVVTHGGVLRAIVAHVLDLPLEEAVRVRVGRNTGLSIVTVHPERWPVLERLNDIAHLEYGRDGDYPDAAF